MTMQRDMRLDATGGAASLVGTPVLHSARLQLRAPTSADWPTYRDFALTDRARFVRPPEFDTERAWRMYASMIGHWVLRGWGSFVFTRKDDDRALGMVGPWFPEGWPEREILWMLWDAGAAGQGYVTEAVEVTLDHVFGTLGWDTAVSYIDPANAPSIRLAERLGAVLDPDAPTSRLVESPNLYVYRHPQRPRS